jgi:hypothetical protein
MVQVNPPPGVGAQGDAALAVTEVKPTIAKMEAVAASVSSFFKFPPQGLQARVQAVDDASERNGQ